MNRQDETETSGPARRRAVLKVAALLAVVVVIVISALVTILIRGAAPPLPADTPEGVVQRYVRAVVDGDVDGAAGYLLPEDAADCHRAQTGGDDDYRVTLVETTIHDDTARVEVIVSAVYGEGPFGPDEYRSDEIFDLRRTDGRWRITAVPWQFAVCDAGGIR